MISSQRILSRKGSFKQFFQSGHFDDLFNQLTGVFALTLGRQRGPASFVSLNDAPTSKCYLYRVSSGGTKSNIETVVTAHTHTLLHCECIVFHFGFFFFRSIKPHRLRNNSCLICDINVYRIQLIEFIRNAFPFISRKGSRNVFVFLFRFSRTLQLFVPSSFNLRIIFATESILIIQDTNKWQITLSVSLKNAL